VLRRNDELPDWAGRKEGRPGIDPSLAVRAEEGSKSQTETLSRSTAAAPTQHPALSYTPAPCHPPPGDPAPPRSL